MTIEASRRPHLRHCATCSSRCSRGTRASGSTSRRSSTTSSSSGARARRRLSRWHRQAQAPAPHRPLLHCRRRHRARRCCRCSSCALPRPPLAPPQQSALTISFSRPLLPHLLPLLLRRFLRWQLQLPARTCPSSRRPSLHPKLLYLLPLYYKWHL